MHRSPPPLAGSAGTRPERTAARAAPLVVWLATTLGGATAARGGFTGSTPAFFSRPTSLYGVESKIHLDRNRFQEASESLTRALHEEPDNVRIAVQLADTHYRLREFDRAIQILENYAGLSTREVNLYYRLGLCYDRRQEYRTALGFYHQALRLDPHLLAAYVKIAQVREKQGLVYDAAKVLRRVLAIKPDYTPALEELAIVHRAIKSNTKNIHRRGNMVFLFTDYRQLAQIERLFPLLDAHRENLEEKLAYRIPAIWLKIVPKVERFNGPPAFYDDIEDSIHVSAAALERQDRVVIAHELAWAYLTRMAKKNAPRWLVEGLALVEAHPGFVDRTPLRTLDVKWEELDRRLTAEKNYLDFEHNPPAARMALLKSYLLVRFLLESYGWPAMRALLDEYRQGETEFARLAPKILNIPFDALMARWNMYAITRYYFGAERDYRF
jgi:tetratricopeptide (TPR) repeat protein